MAGIQIDGVNNKIDFDDDQDTSISSATDDTLVVEVGGNTLATVTATSVTFNDGVEITTADNTDTLTLTSTDADANTGPILKLLRDSGSPANNDLCAVIKLNGDNDANEDTQCYEIRAAWNDVSNGTEDGAVRHALMVGGTLRDVMTLDSGLVVFNEEAQDIDFKIESASQTNMFNLQAVNSSNSAGTIGFNSSNSDGNFFEAVNPQSGVYSTRLQASASSGTIYGMQIFFSGQVPDNNTSQFLVCSDSTAVRLRIYADGDVVNHDNSYGSTSDERIKEQIADASSQWDDVKAMKIRKYKMKEDVAKGDSDAHWRLGVVAQELEAASMSGLVKPEVLYTSDDQEVKDYLYTQKDKDQGLIPDGKDVGDVQIAKKANVGDIKDYKSVKYSILYMKAIKALQEAMTRIETLEAEVTALKGE